MAGCIWPAGVHRNGGGWLISFVRQAGRHFSQRIEPVDVGKQFSLFSSLFFRCTLVGQIANQQYVLLFLVVLYFAHR